MEKNIKYIYHLLDKKLKDFIQMIDLIISKNTKH